MKVTQYLTELQEIEKNFTKEKVIFNELLYNAVRARVKTDIETLLFINQYILSINSNLQMTGHGYYTLNGQQFICAKNTLNIRLSGYLFKNTAPLFVIDEYDVVEKFLFKKGHIDKRTKQPTLNKQGKDLYNKIVAEIVGSELEFIFSEKNKRYVKEMVARDDIVFQAINNGIGNVEKVIAEYRKI